MEYRKDKEIKYNKYTDKEQYVDLYKLKCAFMNNIEYRKKTGTVDNRVECKKIIKIIYDEMPKYIIDNVMKTRPFYKYCIYNMINYQGSSTTSRDLDLLFNEIYTWCERYNTDYHKITNYERKWSNNENMDYPVYQLKP